ncbi:MAG: hypothetical protein HIU91_16695 [Acidobacteria bacterium]|nr:hypothetical protein [Acidobacteriota bacterium]
MTRFIAILLFVGSTSLACNAQDLRHTEAAKAACGTFDDARSSQNAPVTANGVADATVYVLQISNVDGSCLGNCGPNSRIGLDGSWIGLAKGNSLVKVMVTPGEHHLCAWDKSRNKKLAELVALHSLQAEAGHSYYFGLDVIEPTNLGGGWVQYILRPLDEDEAKMLIAAYPEGRSKTKQ